MTLQKKDTKVHNPNWPKILESGKSNALLNLISHKPDSDNFFIC